MRAKIIRDQSAGRVHRALFWGSHRLCGVTIYRHAAEPLAIVMTPWGSFMIRRPSTGLVWAFERLTA